MTRSEGAPRDWSEDGDHGRPGGRPGAAVPASSLTWVGLGLLALLATGLVILGREPGGGRPDEPARVRFRRTPSSLEAVAFAPDGGALAFGHSDGGLAIQDLAQGRPREIDAGPGPTVRALAFSPDGKTLASGGRGASVRLWDVASGTLRASFHGHSAPVGSIAFSPDGKQLASSSYDKRSESSGTPATGTTTVRLGSSGHCRIEVSGPSPSRPTVRQLASGSRDDDGT